MKQEEEKKKEYQPGLRVRARLRATTQRTIRRRMRPRR